MKLLHIPTGALCFVTKEQRMNTIMTYIHVFNTPNHWKSICKNYFTNGIFNKSELFYYDDLTEYIWNEISNNSTITVKISGEEVNYFDPLEFELIE